MIDHLKEPDFMDPACVAAWEELVDELERSDMSPVEAERRWLEVSGSWSSPGCSWAWSAAAERRSLAAWGARELAL